MLIKKKISSQVLSNRKSEYNHYKMKQVTLYLPMRATKIDTIHGSEDYVPVDKNLAGFTTLEEAEKMLTFISAKDPLGVYRVLDLNYQYADNYKQFEMFRYNLHEMRECSFNKGSIDDIKNGLYIARMKLGEYNGTYSSKAVAEQASRDKGCSKGEENVEVRKVFQTFAGYQRYLSALKKISTQITTR